MATKTAKHTPGPWFINGPGHIQATTPIIGKRANGEPIPGNPAIIAKILSENPADTDFIVRACNSHDDLVEACEAALENSYIDADDLALALEALSSIRTGLQNAIGNAES